MSRVRAFIGAGAVIAGGLAVAALARRRRGLWWASPPPAAEAAPKVHEATVPQDPAPSPKKRVAAKRTVKTAKHAAKRPAKKGSTRRSA